jgi:hypothetical protein
MNPNGHGLDIQAPDIYVADTGTQRGRGVFARRDFAEGEVVEQSPVILFYEPHTQLPSAIRRCVFNWVVPGQAPAHAMALGFGTLYNHANPANMCWVADPINFTIRFIAVRPIASGDELTINYNAMSGGSVWFDNNWFVRHQVTLID